MTFLLNKNITQSSQSYFSQFRSLGLKSTCYSLLSNPRFHLIECRCNMPPLQRKNE